MFQSLPSYLKAQGLRADVRTLILLQKAMQRGLVNTLGDIYVVLKGIVTNDPREFGPFSTAFYNYFLEMDIKKGERLEQAIRRSEAFQEWRQDFVDEENPLEEQDLSELIEKYLDEVHLTTFDIKKILSGKDILANDDPNRPDTNDGDDPARQGPVEEGADYSDLTLEELLERMKQVMEQQKNKHTGGDHWVGTQGRSPFGHGGAAVGGIRVGGAGGGKMARAVMNSKQFYPLDKTERLGDDNVDAALAILKGIEEESVEQILDVPVTIKEGLKNGGIFLPHIKEKQDHKVQVILIIDNGGFSMHPYIKQVKKLFSKMKTRFAHDLKVYYFHNTIYGGVFKNAMRTEFISMDKLLSNDPNYSIFVVGDAAMAPYELSEGSQQDWQKLGEKYKRIAWLNPVPENQWHLAMTTLWLKKVIPMYPLTPDGIEKAVIKMNRKRKFSKV